MILQSLNTAQLKEYTAALTAPVIEMRVSVTILDGNEKPIGSLTADTNWERSVYRGLPGVIEGQVDVDDTADVTHQCRLSISDPLKRIDFDPESPGSGALFPNKFLAVEHVLWVESMSQWIASPVFWGPIAHFEREGSQIDMEALGKESLALAPCLLWETIKLAKGTSATDAIKQLLRPMGEARFYLPEIPYKRLAKDINVGSRTEPWPVVKQIAASINMQVFYDGLGRVRLRGWRDDPILTIHDGKDDELDAIT